MIAASTGVLKARRLAGASLYPLLAHSDSGGASSCAGMTRCSSVCSLKRSFFMVRCRRSAGAASFASRRFRRSGTRRRWPGGDSDVFQNCVAALWWTRFVVWGGGSAGLIGGNNDPEVTDSIYDYYLPQATRDKLDEIAALSSYSEFKSYMNDHYGIELDTGLDALKNDRRNDSIDAVNEQCRKIIVAIDAYRETFGRNALSKLKKVYLYDRGLDTQAAYFFNRVGENDPLAGEIHFQQWHNDGRTVFHELAHAYQDSQAKSGEDAVTYSQRVIKQTNSGSMKAYFGANADDYAAEQFADAFGFGFSHGTAEGMGFIRKVKAISKRQK